MKNIRECLFYFIEVQTIKLYFLYNIQKLIHTFLDIFYNTAINFIAAVTNFTIM